MSGLTRFRVPPYLVVTVSAWVSRAIIAVTQLALIRLLVKGIGTEQYAVFALLYSLSGWAVLADFGIGFSIQNFVSEHRAHAEAYGALLKLAIRSTLGILVAEIVMLALACGAVSGRFLRTFGFLSLEERRLLFFAASALLLITGLGQVAWKVWYAEQKGYLSNIVPAVGQLAGVGLVYVVLREHTSSPLVWVTIAYLLPSAILAAASLLFVLLKGYPKGRTDGNLSALVRRSSGFWFFSLGAAAVLQVDFLVISQLLSAHDIATYAVISRVFVFGFVIYSSALSALWPVCSENIAIHRWALVRSHIKTYIMFGSVGVAVFTLIIAAKSSMLLRILAPGSGVKAPLGVLLAFGGYYLVRVWTDTYATVLQSMSFLKPLCLSVPVQAALSIGLQWLFVSRYGIYGCIMGLASSYLFSVAWLFPIAVHSRLASKRQSNEVVCLYSNV